MKKKAEVRKQIKKAALELFIQNHYHFPSMRELSAHCSIPLSSLYSYYHNKQELVEDLIGPLFIHSEQLLRVISSARFSENHVSEEFLEELISATIDFVHKNHQTALLTLSRDRDSIFAKRPEHLVNRLTKIGWSLVNTKQQIPASSKSPVSNSLQILAAAVGEGFTAIFKQYDHGAWIESSVRNLVMFFYTGIENIAADYSLGAPASSSCHPTRQKPLR